MTKEITLTRGKVALVDDADYETVKWFTWHAVASGNRGNFYAKHDIRRGGRCISIALHRFIMQARPEQQVDHINGDGLDCRRSNMRFSTVSQNNMNQRTQIRSKSGYKGVSLKMPRNRWYARIAVDGREIFIGEFKTVIEAALAYDEAARKYHGEFAKTNF